MNLNDLATTAAGGVLATLIWQLGAGFLRSASSDGKLRRREAEFLRAHQARAALDPRLEDALIGRRVHAAEARFRAAARTSDVRTPNRVPMLVLPMATCAAAFMAALLASRLLLEWRPSTAVALSAVGAAALFSVVGTSFVGAETLETRRRETLWANQSYAALAGGGLRARRHERPLRARGHVREKLGGVSLTLVALFSGAWLGFQLASTSLEGAPQASLLASLGWIAYVALIATAAAFIGLTFSHRESRALRQLEVPRATPSSRRVAPCPPIARTQQ